MATEQAINGNYAQQGQGFDQAYAQQTATQAPAQTTSAASSNSNAVDIPKDEVGWYFVEQYYTTLSRTPEKLYLFYNKRSQFVSGPEEQKVDVCVGQKAINERIKELDFENTKVRITNVDSQGSDSNIVIQVIGEISNKAQPHRKFVQTFVLAAQTNGYFVLNDIFRYIQEEEIPEEELQQQESVALPSGIEEPAPTAQEPETEGPAPETVATPEDAAQVDSKLEEVKQQEEAAEGKVSPPPAQVNGTPVPEAAEVVEADEAPVAAVTATEVPSEEEAQAAVAEETAAEIEKPQDPEPTPAPAAAKPAPAATPAAPSKPAAPMSWAAKAAAAAAAAAGNRAAAPAVPAVPAQAPKAAPATQAKPAATPAAAAPAAASSPAARSGSPVDSTQDGWQTAGAEHNKRQSRAQNQPSTESAGVRAYIKNVYESTDADALKAVLSKFDKITYFDVSRAKNAAFVEFATQEGFQAAVAANPHKVGEDSIYVEERRQPGNFGRFPARGGPIGGRGRGGSDNRPGQGRGGFSKEGGRGGFASRGRGGASTPRRGGSAAA